jgi:hypothetical protein
MREIEWMVLSELMKNAKISDRELAKKIGSSQPRARTCSHSIFVNLVTLFARNKKLIPSKGSSESRLLNPRQTKTIRDLLKNDFVEEVNIVRYEKQGKKIIYASPIKLTFSNLKDYSLKVEN